MLKWQLHKNLLPKKTAKAPLSGIGVYPDIYRGFAPTSFAIRKPLFQLALLWCEIKVDWTIGLSFDLTNREFEDYYRKKFWF